ncbi:hypothetical protein CDIK_3082 [Cucumispora dikerogammari]|nr:hypothetical protein CDIK_3082 [Cucumispora dikerogammari]
MLNPIEFCFGKVKTIIRNHIRNHEKQSFALSIVDAMSPITHVDMTGYFTLIKGNCGRALDKKILIKVYFIFLFKTQSHRSSNEYNEVACVFVCLSNYSRK